MKIAVDIDNTLFTCKSVIYKVLNKTQKVGKPNAKKLVFKIVEPGTNNNKSLLRLLFPMFNPSKYYAFKDALETLEKWRDQGHEVILLTNRPSKIATMKKATLDLLDYFDVKYDKLVMGCKNKHLFCKEYGISMLIDDNKQNCINAGRKGIIALHFDPNNKSKLTKNSILYVNSWKNIQFYTDLIDYSLIKNMPVTEQVREEKLNKITSIIDKFKKPIYDEIIYSKDYFVRARHITQNNPSPTKYHTAKAVDIPSKILEINIPDDLDTTELGTLLFKDAKSNDKDNGKEK